MDYSRPARRTRLRRRRPQRRLSRVAVYLLFLNVVCIGVVVSIWLRPQEQFQFTTIPTAQVAPGQVFTAQLGAGNSANAPELSTAAPAPSYSGPLQGGPVPILMYHYIRAVDPNADPMGYGLSVAPEIFDQQMAWLRDNNYHTVSMATAQQCIQGQPVCPPNAIVLTFDDGYVDASTDALPILQRYGMTATFYIVNNYVGQPGYMNWEQVGALYAAGMEIGAHSLDHLDMTTLDITEARRQAEESKRDIEAKLGITVMTFCYPAGRYNAEVANQVRDAGFTNATTTRWDNDYGDMFGLPRRRIEGGKGVDVFAAVVAN